MKRLFAILFSALCVSGCSTNLIYDARFPAGSLDCCIEVDAIHYPPRRVAPMPGNSEIRGSNARSERALWGIRLLVADPSPTDPTGNDVSPSNGIFIEDLKWGKGSHFALRATFSQPNGPHEVPYRWGAGSVVARTGIARRDLPTEHRINLSLREIGGSALLAVTESAADPPKTATKPVPDDFYEKIFKQGYPYTLTLIVDRNTGKGSATLKTDGKEFPLGEFQMNYYNEAEELLTTAGATVAIVDAPDREVSVIVQDFRIYCYREPAGWCP